MPKRASAFVRSDQFCEELQQTHTFSKYESEPVREHEFEGLKAHETVKDTVARILKQSDQFIDIDQIIEFFTVRGRPLALSKFIKGEQKRQLREDTFN